MRTHPEHCAPFVSVLAALTLTFSFNQTARADSWVTNGPMRVAREYHTATLLLNGKVLVAGGNGTNGVTNSAELYDPATGTWTTTGSLQGARENHTATLLLNGEVLVAGGDAGGVSLLSAELYNPTNGTWTAASSLNVARTSHTATLLAGGKVLVAGGVGTIIGEFDKTNSAEIYDPATGMWTVTGSLNTARAWHTATLLTNGQVLVAAGEGFNGSPIANAESYNPAAGTWLTNNSLSIARRYHTATLLPDGQVLVAGGDMLEPPHALASVELFDPAAGTWVMSGSMNTPREWQTAVLLPDGKVLVAGGDTDYDMVTNSVELYDPTAGIWTQTNSLKTARARYTATLLASGKVLVAGGAGTNSLLASTEVYNSSAPGYNQISIQLLSGSNVLLSYTGIGGANYELDRSFSLSTPNWVPQATNPAGSSGALLFTNTANATTNNFWRILPVPYN